MIGKGGRVVCEDIGLQEKKILVHVQYSVLRTDNVQWNGHDRTGWDRKGENRTG